MNDEDKLASWEELVWEWQGRSLAAEAVLHQLLEQRPEAAELLARWGRMSPRERIGAGHKGEFREKTIPLPWG